MAEFLETIETIRAEEASIGRLFNERSDGKGVRRLNRHRRNDPKYMAKLAEAAQFMAEIYKGRRPLHHFQEAMGTEDFPNLFGDVIDRQLLANYREAPYSWNKIVQAKTVRDFRTVNRLTVDGGDAVLAEVPEDTPYPSASLTDGKYQYAVKKYGRKLPFSWEAMINDDLDAFRDIPERFGKAARRSEEKFVTELFWDAAGPHASFFTVGNANIVTSNPALSVPALQTAMQVIAAQVDAGSEPIAIEGFTLWVPPALEVTAQNILNSLQLTLKTSGGGLAEQEVIAVNWMKARMTLAIGPYIPIVNTTSPTTCWALFASPDGQRPAGEVGKLRGHEEPEVFIKAPNAQRVGGGLDPMAGDFDTDSIEYKVRHVFGGARMDPKMAVASQGDGT